MREGDLAKADSLNHIDAGGKYYTVVFRLVRAYRDRDVVEQHKLWPVYWQQLRTINDPLMTGGGPPFVSFAALTSGDIDGAEEAAVIATDSAKSSNDRMGAAMVRALLQASRGRPMAAVASMPQFPQRNDAWGSLLFEPFRRPSRAELLRFRAEVLRSDSAPKDARAAPLVPQFRLYWAALANCQLGDIPQALEQAQQIESLPAPDHWREATRALATDVRAFADIARGDDAGALRRIESIPIDVPLDLINTPAERNVETVWHGELLYRVGRYDEALQWFENSVPSGNGVIVRPFYLLRRAQIHDRRGEVKEAALLYAKFLDYWKSPEPELAPLVNDARNRLAVIQHKVD